LIDRVRRPDLTICAEPSGEDPDYGAGRAAAVIFAQTEGAREYVQRVAVADGNVRLERVGEDVADGFRFSGVDGITMLPYSAEGCEARVASVAAEI